MQTGESFMNQHVNRRAVVSAASAIVAAAATTADAETVADIHWNGIASDGDILCLFEEWRSAYEAATDAGDDEPRTLIG
ncbi:hypothetical protein GCM10007881_64070 [Mesorhizobium huakuii]|nr:hypothetical protein GCM10007881_64070 [Mesorhizobium huakuii]